MRSYLRRNSLHGVGSGNGGYDRQMFLWKPVVINKYIWDGGETMKERMVDIGHIPKWISGNAACTGVCDGPQL